MNETKIRGLSKSDLVLLHRACFWAVDQLNEIRARLFDRDAGALLRFDYEAMEDAEGADFLKALDEAGVEMDRLGAMIERLHGEIDSEPEP